MKNTIVEKMQDFEDWLKDLRCRMLQRKEFVDPNLRMRRKVLRDRIMNPESKLDDKLLRKFARAILALLSVMLIASVIIFNLNGVSWSFAVGVALLSDAWIASLYFALIYFLMYDNKYHFADFPPNVEPGLMLIDLVGVLPVVLVSWICLCRTRRQVYYEDYLQIREQQRREADLAKLSDAERFSPEAEERIRKRDREQFLHQQACDRERLKQNMASDRAEIIKLQKSLKLRCETIRQWQHHLIEYPELDREYLKQNIARDRAQVVKLQKQLKFRRDTVRQWQHALAQHPELDPEIIKNIEAGAGKLCEIPEVVKISYIHNRIMIELRIAYVDKISRRLLGDFIMEVTPSRIICEPLGFGLTANARREFPYLVSEEFLAEIISRNSVRDGFTLGFVQGFIDEFQQEIERYIPREDFYRYFVPIIETQKNAEL